MMKKYLNEIFTVAIKMVIKFIDSIYVALTKRHIQGTIKIVSQALETKTEYVSYQIMPKDTSVIPILDGLNQPQSFAIVMQGPLCKKDNMTVNSIRFYKKTYPSAKIIVSTWNDESEEDISEVIKLGATVVQSEKPPFSGIMNVNYQLKSSLAGVKKAKEMGCEFAVKTRTDQRMCKPFIFDSMISAIKLFPSGNGQRGRIVTLGVCGGGMFIPYHTCDFLYLGYTEDLLNVFSAPLDCRDSNEMQHNKTLNKTRRENSEFMYPPEIYILKHYCKEFLKLSGDDTVKEHWSVTKNHLICYGMNDVELMWNKYDRLYNLNFYSSAYFNGNDSPQKLCTMCFDFFNWFNLYVGNFRYDERYEQYADEALIDDVKKDDRKI